MVFQVPPARDPDAYDWYYQPGYGVTTAEGQEYARQDASHVGAVITMTTNPVSGDWVVPAQGAGLLVNNIHLSPVTVTLELADVDDIEPDGGHTLTVAPGGWGVLPVPASVYGYQPVPLIYNGIPDVAYVQFR